MAGPSRRYLLCAVLVLVASARVLACAGQVSSAGDAGLDARDAGGDPGSDGAGDEGASMDGASDAGDPGGDAAVDGAGDAGGDATGDGAGDAGGDGGGGRAVPVGHCGERSGLYFPESSWIYTDVSDAPVRANSGAMTRWLEDQGGWGNGNHFQIDTSFTILEAGPGSPRLTPSGDDPIGYSEDCDPDVAVPLPAGGRIEGCDDYICPGRVEGDPDGDCHLIAVDFEAGVLYEAYQATYTGTRFYSSCTLAWDMTRDVWGSAPGPDLPPVSERNWGIGRDCTGPDAAGFPIAPLLFTVGDVLSGRVEHAIRFALPNDRMQRAPSEGDEGPVYVWPATHAGGPRAIHPDAPIYGTRWRLKADFDPAGRGMDADNPIVIAVVYGLKHYGMLIADGGSIALMAESDAGCSTGWEGLWGEDGSRVLDGIRPTDFDVLESGGCEAGYDCVRNPDR
ncbi:MAG: hypothetical protein JXR96_23990 [Deltaproteobacteria bacterium]|nr:hypothetical protein [Deltaproteobacteria bacterium]